MPPAVTAFRIRQARLADLPQLWPLARALDSYNLPADRRLLRALVAASVRSFRGERPRSRAKYLFVLERLAGRQRARALARQSRIVGCSLILAKHGTPQLPHVGWDVATVRMASRALRRRVTHRVLRLRVTTDGPTEVGGLIVAAPYRGRPERLGRQLSYVRFAYLAMHPGRFEPQVLAEYLPPLTPQGDSRLWRALGQRFTGLSYRAADRFSATTKEFILRLFPRTPVYVTLLPPEVQRQLGQVHPAAAGACALLQRIGFRRLSQVEPFDGGPYFGARRRRITVARRTRAGIVAAAARPGVGVPRRAGGPWRQAGLLCVEPRRGEFRAVAAAYRRRGPRVEVARATMAQLEARPGMRIHVAPLAR